MPGIEIKAGPLPLPPVDFESLAELLDGYPLEGRSRLYARDGRGWVLVQDSKDRHGMSMKEAGIYQGTRLKLVHGNDVRKRYYKKPPPKLQIMIWSDKDGSNYRNSSLSSLLIKSAVLVWDTVNGPVPSVDEIEECIVVKGEGFVSMA